MASSAFSVKELSEMTGVSTDAIYDELEKTGQILGVPGLKIRTRWVIPRRPIEVKLGLLDPRSTDSAE